ncbi:hypothetical protein PILCRDRAFT_10067 [Piloderma croceum F 1598]|uniref:Uncharacterized protein n=1 Tax=Piloderma croceum (strain F 1598) TaxID=765440 RepID=A0A0C3FJD5_PILCF|nr:hypothetical protein PILCRDRAFT_10067 [Piloderma croceum F 1598]
MSAPRITITKLDYTWLPRTSRRHVSYPKNLSQIIIDTYSYVLTAKLLDSPTSSASTTASKSVDRVVFALLYVQNPMFLSITPASLDAAVQPRSLQSALIYAVERSFHLISVDRDMSTNDTILALANGVAATSSLTKTAVEEIDKDRDEENAHEVTSRISTFALIKTALRGRPKLGPHISHDRFHRTQHTPRLTSLISVSFVPSDESPTFPVLVKGEPVVVDEARAKEILQEEAFEEYLGINTDYRSQFSKFRLLYSNKQKPPPDIRQVKLVSIPSRSIHSSVKCATILRD